MTRVILTADSECSTCEGEAVYQEPHIATWRACGCIEPMTIDELRAALRPGINDARHIPPEGDVETAAIEAAIERGR